MPQAFYGDAISEHIGTTPEGYLVAVGARLCRSGVQQYRGTEVGLETDEIIDVDRPEHEVLSKKFLASLNGKPITDNHPGTFLTAENANWFAKGHVQEPRPGGRLENGDAIVIGDLVITSPDLIERVRSGAVRQLSVGYEYQMVPTGDGGFEQRRLRANHVACVPQGRAGPEIRIMDSIYRESFSEVVRQFLGRNPITVLSRRASDEHKGEPMTKKKLRQLRILLDDFWKTSSAPSRVTLESNPTQVSTAGWSVAI